MRKNGHDGYWEREKDRQSIKDEEKIEIYLCQATLAK
jgi:hypothetical protein